MHVYLYRLLKAAAQNGYLDCLKYALANGCPWLANATVQIKMNDFIAMNINN